ncbi:MAG: dUTP diphosphatase [Saccharofermentanales bacterium]|jgi:dUTP pyrophosphatase
MRESVRVAVQLEPGAKMPFCASDDASGYDVFAHEDATILPGQTALVSTGIRMAMPPFLEAQVRPRSGLSLRTKLRIANAPGTIDADYRGLVAVLCENTASLTDPVATLIAHPAWLDDFHERFRPMPASQFVRERFDIEWPFGLPDPTIYLDHDGDPLGTIKIRAGERIAQLIFMDVVHPELVAVDDVTAIGRDRGGGFGSTGAY